MEPSEECPVCWRTFGLEVTPVVVNCGHTFCESCSSLIKNCALCRKKISSRFHSPNFALMSLIEKVNTKPEIQEQSTQTDLLENFRAPPTPRDIQVPPMDSAFYHFPDDNPNETLYVLEPPRITPEDHQNRVRHEQQKRKYPTQAQKKKDPLITLKEDSSGFREISISFK